MRLDFVQDLPQYDFSLEIGTMISPVQIKELAMLQGNFILTIMWCGDNLPQVLYPVVHNPWLRRESVVKKLYSVPMANCNISLGKRQINLVNLLIAWFGQDLSP